MKERIKKNPILTNHGEKRIKDRIGISKKSSYKNAEKALKYGFDQSKTKGKFNRYLTKLYFTNKCNNILVYNRYVYVFKNNVLITVFNLPKDFIKQADKIQESIPKEE